MTREMDYGDVALGVECALLAGKLPAGRQSRARHCIRWLIAALRRWA